MSYCTVRGCLIGAAIFIHGAVGLAFGDPPTDSISRNPYEQTRQSTQPAEPAHPPEAAPQEPERRTYTADYERACEEPKSPEEADLCQQWRMAKASEELVDIADRQFWATLTEIAALNLVLIFTAWASVAASRSARSADRSAIATQKAADAAHEANRITRELWAAEQRAWVRLKEIRITSPLRWEHGDGRLTFVFTFHNIGQMPARKVGLSAHIWIPAIDDAHTILARVSESARQMGLRMGNTIFPHEELATEFTTGIAKRDIDRYSIWKRQRGWPDDMGIFPFPILTGCIEYSIAEDDRRYTAFLFSIVGDDPLIWPTHGDIPAERLRLVREPTRLGEDIIGT